MAKRINKNIRDLAQWAEPYGWNWKATKNGHVAWYHPNVPGMIVTSGTPKTPESRKPRQQMRTAYKIATGEEMCELTV